MGVIVCDRCRKASVVIYITLEAGEWELCEDCLEQMYRWLAGELELIDKDKFKLLEAKK